MRRAARHRDGAASSPAGPPSSGRRRRAAPEYMWLQLGRMGLRPGHVGLQPGHMGLRPGHVGLQPGHLGCSQLGRRRLGECDLVRHFRRLPRGRLRLAALLLVHRLVSEDRGVRGAHLGESLDRVGRVGVAVGMERQRELVVRPLDLLRARVLRQAQNCVGLLGGPRRETAAQQRRPWKPEERSESVCKRQRKQAVRSAKPAVGFEPRLRNGGRRERAASRPVANALSMCLAAPPCDANRPRPSACFVTPAPICICMYMLHTHAHTLERTIC